MIRPFLATLGVLALTFVTGCQMSGATTQPVAGAAPQRAILVTGGQSGGTEIFLPSGPDKVVMLSTSGDTKICPQCEADAIKYFDTGVLVEKCSMCGATRTAYTYTPPPTNVGHN